MWTTRCRSWRTPWRSAGGLPQVAEVTDFTRPREALEWLATHPVDLALLDSVRVLVLRLLLMQSLCAILLLVVSTFRSKSLGMILAVLFGLRLTGLIYMGLSEALNQVFGQGAVNIALYMPDTVMNEDPLETVKAIVVAVVTGAIFPPLAIRIFDRKDVK